MFLRQRASFMFVCLCFFPFPFPSASRHRIRRGPRKGTLPLPFLIIPYPCFPYPFFSRGRFPCPMLSPPLPFSILALPVILSFPLAPQFTCRDIFHCPEARSSKLPLIRLAFMSRNE